MYPPIKLRSTPSLWLKGGRLNYIRVPRIPQGFHACRTGAASPGSCGVCRCVEYMYVEQINQYPNSPRARTAYAFAKLDLIFIREKGPAVGVGWWCKCHTGKPLHLGDPLYLGIHIFFLSFGLYLQSILSHFDHPSENILISLGHLLSSLIKINNSHKNEESCFKG
jgi:hypothetical protein